MKKSDWKLLSRKDILKTILYNRGGNKYVYYSGNRESPCK